MTAGQMSIGRNWTVRMNDLMNHDRWLGCCCCWWWYCQWGRRRRGDKVISQSRCDERAVSAHQRVHTLICWLTAVNWRSLTTDQCDDLCQRSTSADCGCGTVCTAGDALAIINRK